MNKARVLFVAFIASTFILLGLTVVPAEAWLSRNCHAGSGVYETWGNVHVTENWNGTLERLDSIANLSDLSKSLRIVRDNGTTAWAKTAPGHTGYAYPVGTTYQALAYAEFNGNGNYCRIYL